MGLLLSISWHIHNELTPPTPPIMATLAPIHFIYYMNNYMIIHNSASGLTGFLNQYRTYFISSLVNPYVRIHVKCLSQYCPVKYSTMASKKVWNSFLLFSGGITMVHWNEWVKAVPISSSNVKNSTKLKVWKTEKSIFRLPLNFLNLIDFDFVKTSPNKIWKNPFKGSSRHH